MTKKQKEIIDVLSLICMEHPELRVTQIIDDALEMFGLNSKELYYISNNDLYNALNNFYNKTRRKTKNEIFEG